MPENTQSNIAIVGAGGRMGESLRSLIGKDKDLNYAYGFGRGEGLVGDWSKADAKISALIDFSSPVLFLQALDFCVQNKIPFVSGTTGLNHIAFDKLNDCLLYTSPSPRDATLSRMPSSA